MMVETTFMPVSGSVQVGRIFGLPFLSQCSMVTMTWLPEATKSIAPPCRGERSRWKETEGDGRRRKEMEAHPKGAEPFLRRKKGEDHVAHHALDQLARDEVVGHIAIGGDLRRAEDA